MEKRNEAAERRPERKKPSLSEQIAAAERKADEQPKPPKKQKPDEGRGGKGRDR